LAPNPDAFIAPENYYSFCSFHGHKTGFMAASMFFSSKYCFTRTDFKYQQLTLLFSEALVEKFRGIMTSTLLFVPDMA
jgi:hypothetical protein